MMRPLSALCCLALVVSFVVLAGTPAVVAASDGERILLFESDIVVHEDASLEVSETITVRALGEQIRRGIYRDFPTSYRDNAGNRYVVGFDLLSVLRDGAPSPYHINNISGGKRVYIGKEDVFITPGEYTYTLQYRTTRQLGFFEDHDELYWNVTGTEWVFPIDEASASVLLPEGIPADALKLAGYTGPFGAQGKDFSADVAQDGAIIFTATRPFGAYEGLTIVVGWPKGFVQEPSVAQKLGWLFADNFVVLIPFLYLFGYGAYWWRNGRDPKGRGTIVAQYEPPDKLSPSEIGVIIDQSADRQDLGAAVVYLAEQGFIKIKLIEEDRFLGLGKKKDWELSRIENSPRQPDIFEGKLLDALRLFGGKYSVPVQLKDLKKGVFAQHIQDLHKKLYEQVVEKGYLAHNPETVRGIAIVAAIGSLIVVGIIANIISGGLGVLGWISLIVSVVIAIGFSVVMPKRTHKGRLAYEHILGFKEYLSVAEKERIKFHNPPTRTPELFEKWLPYAMVLKVEDKWAQQFKDMMLPPPSWYEGAYVAGSWNSVAFANSVSSTAASMNSAFTSPAPGSSSGFGGGGGSGGGGGGGGGGGW